METTPDEVSDEQVAEFDESVFGNKDAAPVEKAPSDPDSEQRADEHADTDEG